MSPQYLVRYYPRCVWERMDEISIWTAAWANQKFASPSVGRSHLISRRHEQKKMLSKRERPWSWDMSFFPASNSDWNISSSWDFLGLLAFRVGLCHQPSCCLAGPCRPLWFVCLHNQTSQFLIINLSICLSIYLPSIYLLLVLFLWAVRLIHTPFLSNITGNSLQAPLHIPDSSPARPL